MSVERECTFKICCFSDLLPHADQLRDRKHVWQHPDANTGWRLIIFESPAKILFYIYIYMYTLFSFVLWVLCNFNIVIINKLRKIVRFSTSYRIRGFLYMFTIHEAGESVREAQKDQREKQRECESDGVA